MKKIEIAPELLVIDLFCGAGGTTTGFAQAEVDGNKVVKIIACVNHDANAIRSHWMNHKDVKHFEEDIRTLNLTGLLAIADYYRGLYPKAKLILWASLECTNFSKAKGGQPRDADSRTLAEHLYRYVAALNPDYIQIENVVEFKSWGPLDENGKPTSRDKGRDWMKWRKHIRKFGYKDDWTEINSADLGAFTSRNRLFGCFAKKDLPIIWPEVTHSKKGGDDMFGGLKKWKAVKEVLNFDVDGNSIFGRKKDLSDRTLERIYAGLVKFVAKGDTDFIQKYYGGRPAGKVIPTSGPAGTITTFASQALVQSKFLAHYYTHGFVTSVDNPCPTLRTKDSATLISADRLDTQVQSVNQPTGTIMPKDKHSVVNCVPFVSPTVVYKNEKYFIDQQYGNSKPSDINSVCGALTNNPKHSLVKCEPFLMPTGFYNKPTSTDQPLGTITADRHHTYIVNPSHGGHTTSTERPCPVIVARQDKAPLQLIEFKSGNAVVPVYDTDSEVCIRIKHFMAHYELSDIKMRMLLIDELLLIQGLMEKGGPDYEMVGTQADKKKFIGNSVHPMVPKAMAEAMAYEINKIQ